MSHYINAPSPTRDEPNESGYYGNAGENDCCERCGEPFEVIEDYGEGGNLVGQYQFVRIYGHPQFEECCRKCGAQIEEEFEGAEAL